jgi:replication fork clamp-binding protein CrfC
MANIINILQKEFNSRVKNDWSSSITQLKELQKLVYSQLTDTSSSDAIAYASSCILHLNVSISQLEMAQNSITIGY